MSEQPLVLPSKLPFISSVSVPSLPHLQAMITASGPHSSDESLVGLQIMFLKTI